jgi:hypothetical protein
MKWSPSTAGVLCVLFGGFFAVCEIYGTYSYFVAQQGGLDYVVLMGSGIAAAVPFIPPVADIAGRRGWRGLGRALWLALPLALIVVMMAALQRTGAGTDEAEKDRNKGRAALELAKQNKAEAEAEIRKLGTVRALADIQTELAKSKLDPLYARSGKCSDATAKASRVLCTTVASLEGEEEKAKELAKYQKAVREARAAIAAGSGASVDSLASRVSGYTGGMVTEDQVRLWQPLFIPILASWLSAAFLTIGIRCDFSFEEAPAAPRTTVDSKPAEPIRSDPTPLVRPNPTAPRASNVVDMPRKPVRPPPNSSAKGDSPTRPKIDAKPLISYMAAHVPEASGETADWGEMLKGFHAWCAQQEPPIAPMDKVSFGLALTAICKNAEIRTQQRNGRVYCVNRKVVA